MNSDLGLAVVKRQKLGQTGAEVSRLGLGCATFGREIDEATSFRLMDYAITHGISLFDTAEAYGGGQARDYRRSQLQIDDVREVSDEQHSSEKIIGRWLRATAHRKEIFLVSKVTTNFSRRHVLEALQVSLERLQTDHLDLYLFHNFDQSTPLEEALEAMQEVRRAGLTRFVGCSNFTADQTRDALALGARHGSRVDVVQAVCNLASRDAAKELLPLCSQEEIGFLAYSPLAAGFLTGKYSADWRQIPPGSRFHVIPSHADIYFNERSFQALRDLQAMEKSTGIPAVQLAAAWVLAHPAITSVLCGARDVGHLENALSAMSIRLADHGGWPATLQLLN